MLSAVRLNTRARLWLAELDEVVFKGLPVVDVVVLISGSKISLNVPDSSADTTIPSSDGMYRVLVRKPGVDDDRLDATYAACYRE